MYELKHAWSQLYTILYKILHSFQLFTYLGANIVHLTNQ